MPRPLLLATRVLGAAVLLAPAARPQSYATHVYQERQGLPSGVVYDIAQESSGRMWFATRGGLVSFDGDDWRKEYVPEETRPPLSRLVIDAQDRLWASSHHLSSGLVVREPDGSWLRIARPRGLDDSEEELVVGLRPVVRPEGAGLAACTRTALFEYVRGTWTESPLPPELAPVNDFDLQGERVLLASETGLWEGRPGDLRRIELSTPGRAVRALAPTGPEPDAPVWLVGDGWVALLADGLVELVHEHDVPERLLDTVREGSGSMPAVADGRRGLWFAHETSLARIDAASGRVRVQGVENGFSGAGANSLYRDLDGNTWVATQRGITRVPSARFVNFDQTSGLLANEVSSLVEHPIGRLVLGQPGGVCLIDLETERVEALPLPGGQSRDVVLDMAVDRAGIVWLAASHFGMARLTPDGELLPVAEGSRSRNPQTVHCDPSGRVWVGADPGVFLLEEGELVAVEEAPIHTRVRNITTLADGTLAVSTTTEGTWLRTPAGWKALRGPGPRSATSTYAAYLDRSGRLLVGALDGLYVLDGDRLRHLVLGEGPEATIVDPVYSINQDGGGRLWFGTQLGVVGWDGRRVARYGVHEGLPALEANRAANLEDSNGAMWFGTVKGVARYSACDDVPSERPPVVDRLAVEVEGRLHGPFEHLDLANEDNDPIFRFKAISFRDSSGIEYRSRLEGFDQDWIPTGQVAAGLVRYSNLPAGTYRFAVQARSPSGPWSETRRTGTLRIRPPFWLSGWFLGACALSLAGLGLGLWRLSLDHRTARSLRREVDRRTAELLRSQKLESLGLLAGGVAHDFNNLLTAIMAHCELAREDGVSSVEDHLQSIDVAAERGAMLTRALLGYARRQEASPRVLGIDRRILEMQAILRPLIRAEIDLRLELGGDELAAYLDPGQLEQLVMNLVVNASDAMPSGGLLEIETSRVDLREPCPIVHGEILPAGSWVRIAISDTGVGMDEHTSARVFDPFFTTKSAGRGTGLGLSTCHGIVKQNGGFIDFETCQELGPKRGTTFRIYLPAVESAAARQGAHTEAPAIGELLGARVLLAEDDALVRPMLARTLQRAGCRVLVASSGEEALAAACRHAGQIDLLVTDVIMPGMSGPELREHLLDLHPDVLTLFISGYTADVLEERDSSSPTSALLGKPFTPEDLLQAAARMLAADRPFDLTPPPRTRHEPADEPDSGPGPGTSRPGPRSPRGDAVTGSPG